MTFFRDLARSCYDLAWYREVRTRLTVGAAFRYAAFLHLLLAAVAACVMIPGLLKVRADAVVFVRDEMPDASITLKDGRLSTTLPTPFEREFDGFHVILDPSVEGTSFPGRLTAEDPGVLFGRDAVFMRVPEEPDRVVTYDPATNETVTSAQALAALEVATIPLVILAIVLGLIGFGVLSFIANVVFALSAAALLVALGRNWGAPLDYKTWLRVSLHAITLPVLVDVAALLLGLTLPFVFTGLYILIVSAVFIDEKNQPTAAPPVPAPPAPPVA